MSKYERFFMKMATSIVNGGKYCSISSSDTPPCPDCGNTMNFNGGNLKPGDGNWVCKECGFAFTENEYNQIISDCYDLVHERFPNATLVDFNNLHFPSQPGYQTPLP